MCNKENARCDPAQSEDSGGGGTLTATQTNEATADRRFAKLDTMLGERVRHRRKAQNMSLKEVAQLANISISLLSQIERGISSPSVRVLASLANALNVGLGNLFDESLNLISQERDKIVVRAGERKHLGFWRTGISKELLTPQTGESGLEIFMVVIEPGGNTGSQVYTHEGEEGGMVLEGAITIEVDGKVYQLSEGDSFRFGSGRPHSFSNVEKEPARVIWVNAHVSKAD
jgi:transcriptional regulator with XRE-family HTH domain